MWSARAGGGGGGGAGWCGRSAPRSHNRRTLRARSSSTSARKKASSSSLPKRRQGGRAGGRGGEGRESARVTVWCAENQGDVEDADSGVAGEAAARDRARGGAPYVARVGPPPRRAHVWRRRRRASDGVRRASLVKRITTSEVLGEGLVMPNIPVVMVGPCLRCARAACRGAGAGAAREGGGAASPARILRGPTRTGTRCASCGARGTAPASLSRAVRRGARARMRVTRVR